MEKLADTAEYVSCSGGVGCVLLPANSSVQVSGRVGRATIME